MPRPPSCLGCCWPGSSSGKPLGTCRWPTPEPAGCTEPGRLLSGLEGKGTFRRRVSSLQGQRAAYIIYLHLREVGGCLFPLPCGRADLARSRQREGRHRPCTGWAAGGGRRGAQHRSPASAPPRHSPAPAAPSAPQFSRPARLQLLLPCPPSPSAAASPGLTASAGPAHHGNGRRTGGLGPRLGPAASPGPPPASPRASPRPPPQGRRPPPGPGQPPEAP